MNNHFEKERRPLVMNPVRLRRGLQDFIRAGGGFSALIFIIAITLSIVGFVVTSSSVDNLRSNVIERRIDEYGIVMGQSFREYNLLQLGSIGRIESAVITPIPEAAWKQYIEVYDPLNNFSSLKYISVSFGSVPSENKVYYIEPVETETQKLLGKTISSLGISEQILIKAATNDTTTTSRSQKSGLFLVTPFYDIFPLKNQDYVDTPGLRGFTVTLIDQQKLFSSLLRQERLIESSIHVFYGEKAESNLLYQSDNRQNKGSTVITKKQKVPFFDTELTVIYNFDAARVLPWYATYFPGLILASGMIIGLFLAMLAGRLMSRRFSAINIEKENEIAFAQNELLSLASHQLRTPATGVKQYLGMLLQGFAGQLTPKQRLYLERAYASNDRQLSVINDILHVAKLSSGRIVLSERQFDLTKLIRDIIDEHKSEIKKAKLNLSISMPSRGIIFADSHMLRMVFENILSNSIKYTLTGGAIKITVMKRHDHWFIIFADTGVGIEKADMPKLFKQFSRIKNPLTDKVAGTGVGLYLAYHLTELHGGWIKVTSRPQKGTSFTICLPKNGKKKNKL